MSSERRHTDREQLPTLLPVSLLVRTAQGERQVSGCLFDVSAEGLCLILREDLVEGASASLVMLNERVALRVAWSHKDAERAFRCGLRSIDPGLDLRRLFSSRFIGRAS